MLSLSVNTLKSLSPSIHNHNKFLFSSFSYNLHQNLHKPSCIKPISASYIPASTPPSNPQQLYQPFRPPPSTTLPSEYRSLDTNGRIGILANRLGLWKPLGYSAVEQNRLVVAAQVRDSLVKSNTDPEVLSAFDTGGAELLYEIRLVSATQRAASARFVIENRLDAEGAQDLARAMKDFPRRRGDKGWESFDYNLPGDCLSFMYFRQSREHKDPSEQRTAALELALKVAGTERSKRYNFEGIGGENRGNREAKKRALKKGFGFRAEERYREILEAPFECRSEGEFGVVVSEKGWKRWVVLPGWEYVVGLGQGGVVVSFADARALPWKVNRWYKEESILVVANRGRKEVSADDGFYLVEVDGSDWGLKVERGSTLKGMGVNESLGTVVLVVRPPKEKTEDQLADDDWE
ncbi:rubisco accumulation factor 1, chloroplastic [Quillaja saponaria]|uniref:Rubisco accumulation factor 1, chloroplastic n=1 Tax=Quillaja saponaria TaxID=32244 RepID=A0AAD7Q2S2_QUISA|nr:rubisco accumulation factor 1, chloroplastic [Quillaja saponaria]